MVDSISTATIKASDLRVAAVARTAPVAAPLAPATSQTDIPETTAPTTLAKAMSVAPPVDSDRVKAIKTAIANGTFPLSPSTIADQMIALKYEWMSND